LGWLTRESYKKQYQIQCSGCHSTSLIIERNYKFFLSIYVNLFINLNSNSFSNTIIWKILDLRSVRCDVSSSWIIFFWHRLQPLLMLKVKLQWKFAQSLTSQLFKVAIGKKTNYFSKFSPEQSLYLISGDLNSNRTRT